MRIKLFSFVVVLSAVASAVLGSSSSAASERRFDAVETSQCLQSRGWRIFLTHPGGPIGGVEASPQWMPNKSRSRAFTIALFQSAAEATRLVRQKGGVAVGNAALLSPHQALVGATPVTDAQLRGGLAAAIDCLRGHGGRASVPAGTGARIVARTKSIYWKGAIVSLLQANIRATLPAIEAYFADNNTYVGATLERLRRDYDRGLRDVRIARTSASSYCIESTLHGVTMHKVGPAGDTMQGRC